MQLMDLILSGLDIIAFQSPNYRVTRCNLTTAVTQSCGMGSFSPQTIGSRDATRLRFCQWCLYYDVSVPKLSGHAMQPEELENRAQYLESSFSPQTIGSRDATDPYPFLMDLII